MFTNKIWTGKIIKSGASVLKAISITEGYIIKSCQQFQSYLKTKPDIPNKFAHLRNKNFKI